MTWGTSSTGVPMDKSIIPFLCERALSPAAAIRSQGKSGRPEASGVNSFSAPAEATTLQIQGRCWSYQLLLRHQVNQA